MNNVIKLGRAKKELTQAQLAELVGVSVQTVRNWERRDTQPNAKYIVELSSLLEIDRGDIVTFYANK